MDSWIMEQTDAHGKKADKIAKGAHQLFSRYGIRAITMDDIAQNLGVSKKTVYKHFADKNALVENLVDKEILLNKVNYKLLIDSNHDAVLELFLILAGIKNLYFKINPSIIRELTINHPAAYHKFAEHKYWFIDEAIKSCIQKGIDEGLFQTNLLIHVRARFFLESLTMISDNNLDSFKRYNAQNLATEIFGHLIAGIATAKGIDLISRYKNKHKLLFIFNHLNQYLEDSGIRWEINPA